MSYARKMMVRLAGAVAVSTLAFAGTADAFEPNKPVDFVIMAGQGGGADQMARLMQSIVEKEGFASKPLVPTNKGGGSGAEALMALNSATDPDHTIMVTLNSFFTTPIRQPGLGIDQMTFAPIARMADDSFVLWVHKNEGVSTFEEFVAAAKERGSDWVMGGTGKAQEDEIITSFLNAQFGLDIKYIPYDGGGAVAKDLAGEQIDSSVNNPSEALGFYESGDLIPLVTFTEERLPQFPDTPTISEVGADWAYTMQRAVVGAPGMSPEALAYYQEVFKKVYESEDWQAYMAKQSLSGDLIAGDELKSYWSAQLERHKKLLAAN